MSGHGPPSKVVARERGHGLLHGPRREVVYIFEREGDRSGTYWLLVLECGHSVTRPRVSLAPHTLFRPLSEKLAPKHAQCFYCEAGCEKRDPWLAIEALGGSTP